MYFVDDSIVTNSNSPCLSTGKLLDSPGSRFFGKLPYGRKITVAIGLWNFRKLLLSAPFN
jgi:hypothetical protein